MGKVAATGSTEVFLLSQVLHIWLIVLLFKRTLQLFRISIRYSSFQVTRLHTQLALHTVASSVVQFNLQQNTNSISNLNYSCKTLATSQLNLFIYFTRDYST